MAIRAQWQSPVGPVLHRFVSVKIALGRDYANEQRVLGSLDAFLTNDHSNDLNAEVFERWCQSQTHLKSGIRRNQMRIVRNFCLYRQRNEPNCFVPDLALFPPTHQAITPYHFSDEEIAQLLDAAETLLTTAAYPLRAQAIRLAIVLLYTAGLRRSELIGLTIGDYDRHAKTVLIRASKFRKSRLLPLSEDAGQELEAYLSARQAYRPDSISDEAPLVWRGGANRRGYTGPGFGQVFRHLTRQAGIGKADGQTPRVHDVRHSFAVNALLRWYRSGAEVQAKLPLLSLYMGHVCIASTQYYLRFVEPLSSAASERFARHCSQLISPIYEEDK